MERSLLIVASLLVCTYTADSNRRCLECTDSPSPDHCRVTTECAVGQECVLKQIVTSGGQVLYNLGCQSQSRCDSSRRDLGFSRSIVSRRGDLTTCIECCDKNYCNFEGCGFVATKQAQRGPVCFHCNYETSPDGCRRLQPCDYNEVCMLRELPPSSVGGLTSFEATCRLKPVCDTFALIGRKRHDYCHTCCAEDFCNENCEEASHTSPTPQISSTHSITTTPHISSTHPTTINIPTKPSTTTTSTTTTTTTTTTTQTTSPTHTHAVHKTTTPTPVSTTTTHEEARRHFCLKQNYTYDSGGHMCFKMHWDLKTWNDASLVCKQEGGMLAMIRTHAKWESIKKALLHAPFASGHAVYLGGKDQESPDNNYHWPNGERVSQPSFWGPGQPTCCMQNCMVAHTGSHPDWSARRCDQLLPYICTLYNFHLH